MRGNNGRQSAREHEIIIYFIKTDVSLIFERSFLCVLLLLVFLFKTPEIMLLPVCGTPFVGIKVAFAAAAFALSRNRSIGICDFPIAVVSLSQYYFHGIFSFFFLPLSIENIKTTDNVTTSGQETLLPHNYIKRQQKRRCCLQYPVMKRMYCIMNSQFHLELKLG